MSQQSPPSSGSIKKSGSGIEPATETGGAGSSEPFASVGNAEQRGQLFSQLTQNEPGQISTNAASIISRSHANEGRRKQDPSGKRM